ncbi:DNA internalization-related competence protein ComEC/Rec2 [Advenella mimigardefordensis]|uniref:Putative DNA internalization-like competence protein ComEC/Rec2 n=1 Tax=Advenella mimigardefordensis (strain DSM 17166 / LMG 22922 / DPN7) TaxID=1247726 RepID=W0PEL2_ADVMD|nr:putative DNA internalization-like competence protein ComEC/Rec2 [Advenella mimigardefordensis DPN7]
MVSLHASSNGFHAPCALILKHVFVRNRLLIRIVLPLCVLGLCLISGMLYSVWRAQSRLADSLDRHLENRPLTVQVQVAGLPRDLINGWAFEARIIGGPSAARVPERVLLRWYSGARGGPYSPPQRPQAGLPDLRPGQIWQMTVKLRRNHASRNFHGFDYDAYLFAAGLRASGTVIGPGRLLRDELCRDWGSCIERARFSLRRALIQVLQDKRYAPVIIALVMGDQAGISKDDWNVFNLTGITHLVSISGSHITMLAALGSVGVFRLWRRMRLQGKQLAERRPAQIVAVSGGLVVAAIYSVLAGWGVPAQRTFMMLVIFWLSAIGRVRVKGPTLLALSALCILLLDPWAVLSVGFCLSFAAIACLMLWGARSERRVTVTSGLVQKGLQRLWDAAKMQLFMSVALAPLLIGLFQQYAFVSPLVNAFAIPVIGGMVTPLALLLAVLCATGSWPSAAVWLADRVHWLLEQVLAVAHALAGMEWAAADFPAVPGYWVVLGMAGLVVFVLPRGLPGRASGLALMIPALFFRPARPLPGEWFMTALDVGQGAAVLVSTREHHLLFDTGLRTGMESDSGNQVIVPYLRAAGIDTLDELIISHSDLDHAGGAGSVLQQVNVRHAYASFALNQYLEREQDALQRDLLVKNRQATFDLCRRGVRFAYDGVQFRFYHPSETGHIPLKADNNHSCVLRIQGKHQSALLTGDIDASVEARLLQAPEQLPATDVIMAPHHGSASSSSVAFARAMQPALVFAQAGYLNRYGHPAGDVAARWRATAQLYLDTIEAGAIRIRSGADGLWVNSARSARRRYWDGF